MRRLGFSLVLGVASLVGAASASAADLPAYLTRTAIASQEPAPVEQAGWRRAYYGGGYYGYRGGYVRPYGYGAYYRPVYRTYNYYNTYGYRPYYYGYSPYTYGYAPYGRPYVYNYGPYAFGGGFYY